MLERAGLARVPAKIEITVNRLIPAPAADVFDVWLDLLPRRRASGQNVAHYGRFLVLERPRQIECTWASEATKGLEVLSLLAERLCRRI